MEESIRTFGDNAATTIHPVVLTIFITAAIFMFISSKKRIATIFLFLSLVFPINQEVVVAGLNLNSIRILIVIGFAALYLTSGFKIKFTNLDRIIVIWAIAKVAVVMILWQQMSVFINMMGFLMTTFGIYFLFRATITNGEDVDWLLKGLVAASLIIALSMTMEQITGRNVFADLGRFALSAVREGRLRAQGPFQHPISAGMFGAVMLPLYVMQLHRGRPNKIFWIIGATAAFVIVIFSASSGPVLSCLAGIGALVLWNIRHQMRMIRWSALFCLVALHLVMKAPVWALIGRVGVVGGSTGYHRVDLINKFVGNFGEWWFLGTKDTRHWGYGMDDMINAFVKQGVEGGLLGLMLFIFVIVTAYKIIGERIKKTKDRSQQLFIWALGASLFVHVIGFFGISYWDQQLVIWYLLLAIISALKDRSATAVNNESTLIYTT